MDNCESELNNCAPNLDACQDDLGDCATTLATCQANLCICNDSLNTCSVDLISCQNEVNEINNTMDKRYEDLMNAFQDIFKDTDFDIPGDTNLDKFNNLIDAIMDFNKQRQKVGNL